MIGIGLCWMALAQEPAELSPRLAAPTRDASKEALEKYKKAVSRLPMPPEPDPASGPVSKVNNGRFRAYYIPAELRETPGVRVPGGANPAGAAPRQGEPAFSLDNTFKVKLFWISSRANDCFY